MNNILLNKANKFLDEIVHEISASGINISDLKMDHIAYSTNTSQEYEEALPKLLKHGNLVKEALISDRRVAVIKLDKPIGYKSHVIEVVELIEPKKRQNAMSGWEHVEFLVDDYNIMLSSYQNFNWDTSHMNREHFSRLKLTLPSGREVKFLNTPVLLSVAEEKLEN